MTEVLELSGVKKQFAQIPGPIASSLADQKEKLDEDSLNLLKGIPVQTPDLIGTEILPVRLEHIAAVKLLVRGLLVGLLLPGEPLMLGIVLDPVITRNARISLRKSPDRLLNLLACPNERILF